MLQPKLKVGQLQEKGQHTVMMMTVFLDDYNDDGASSMATTMKMMMMMMTTMMLMMTMMTMQLTLKVEKVSNQRQKMHNLVQTSHIKMSHPFENFLPISAKSPLSSSSSSLGQMIYYLLKFSINVMTMSEDDGG